jgi:hypothetical protein
MLFYAHDRAFACEQAKASKVRPVLGYRGNAWTCGARRSAEMDKVASANSVGVDPERSGVEFELS